MINSVPPGQLMLLNWRGNALRFLTDQSGYLRRMYCTYGGIVSLNRYSQRVIFVFAPQYTLAWFSIRDMLQ